MKIKKEYLVFREDAKRLAKASASQMQRQGVSRLSWDFSSTRFISRSFADELLSIIAKMQKEHTRIRIVGLEPKLQKFIALVRQARQKAHKEILSAA